LQHINDERLMNIHRDKDHDRMMHTYHRHRIEHQRTDLHDAIQEQRRFRLEQQSKRRVQVQFSQTLNSKYSSIANSLEHHENTVRRQQHVRHARHLVAQQKRTSEEQSRLIEKYLTQRKHVRRALSSIERQQLDLRTMRDANERLLQAQQRVAHIRTREANIRQFSLVKMSMKDETTQQTMRSLTESMLERESLFDTIVDHVAAQQTVQTKT
jgi:hypothetical protein